MRIFTDRGLRDLLRRWSRDGYVYGYLDAAMKYSGERAVNADEVITEARAAHDRQSMAVRRRVFGEES